MVNESAGDGCALFFSARELTGKVVKAVAESDSFEELCGAFAGFAFAFRPAPGESWDEGVFESGELREEVMLLKDEAEVVVSKVGGLFWVEGGEVLLVDGDLSTSGGKEGSEDIKEGGFSTSRGADDGSGGAGFCGEVEFAKDGDGFAGCLVFEVEVAGFDHGKNLTCFCWSQSSLSLILGG